MAAHKRPRVVIVGAGHATLVALGRLARRRPFAELTLVSRGHAAHYSGLVPGWIEGIYPEGAMAIPIRPFAERCGATFVSGEVAAADAEGLHLTDGRTVPYDILVVNTGSITARYGPLSAPGVIPAKPFETLLRGLRPRLDTARSFLVAGAGVAGIEIAFALRRRRPGTLVTLIDERDTLLPQAPARARRRVLDHLRRAGIELRLGARLSAVEFGEAHLSDGSVLQAACTVAATGARPQPWLDATPFARAPDGFIAVDDTLRSVSHPRVLAVGDAATRLADPRPKAGVFAVRAGPPLALAIRRLADDAPLRPARIQQRALVLLSMGNRTALGFRNGIVAEGPLVWRLKDRLDRGFVRRFVDA